LTTSASNEGGPPQRQPLLIEVLDLEQTGSDAFGSPLAATTQRHYYGGQVAAHALVAAGRTVPEGKEPGVLHCAFLSRGDPARPVEVQVERVRDGGSVAVRRADVVQDGKLLLTAMVSFRRAGTGPDAQVEPVPEAGDPELLKPAELPLLLSTEFRLPPQPVRAGYLPTRFWARCTDELDPDPLLHAAVLTYFSDMSTGLAFWHGGPQRPMVSLEHTLWFHRQVRLDEWVVVDLVARTVASGRGWYSGTVHTRDGVLGASLAQESLLGL
jgi:acyl-CoA thioesterase-2